VHLIAIIICSLSITQSMDVAIGFWLVREKLSNFHTPKHSLYFGSQLFIIFECVCVFSINLCIFYTILCGIWFFLVEPFANLSQAFLQLHSCNYFGKGNLIAMPTFFFLLPIEWFTFAIEKSLFRLLKCIIRCGSQSFH